jgi:hypothetical protein
VRRKQQPADERHCGQGVDQGKHGEHGTLGRCGDPAEKDPRIGREVQRSGNVGTAGISTLRREVALFPPCLTTTFRWSAAALVSAAAVLRRSVATPVTRRPTDIRFRQGRSASCKIFQILTVR